MSYLSRRSREIRAEEARRKEPKNSLGIDWGWPEHGELFPLPLEHKRAEFPAGWPWGRGA
jgi:hypothetical protein